MPKRIGSTTRDYIESAATPSYPGKSYAVIPHKEVIDATFAELAAAGLHVERELYKCNMGASVVRGVYHIQGSNDKDLEMIFAWVNSYDKTKRFQCCIGAHIRVSGAYYISGDMGSWSRKHTGNALAEAIVAMQTQISNAGTYYNELLQHKHLMKKIILSEEKRADILGRLYFEKEYLTSEQAGIIKSQMKKPMDYNADEHSLWALNGHISYALTKSHPRDWITDQIQVSKFINNMFKLSIPVQTMPIVTEQVDPSQINLLDMIQDIEKEQEPPEPEISFEL